MLAFVTSLRHPLNSTNYDRVEQLLQQTLRAVNAQTSSDYCMVIVGNQRPCFDLPKRTIFVHVDHPPPSSDARTRIPRGAVLRDKGAKLAIGAVAARAFSPSHIMVLDADDLVSRRLAGFVTGQPSSAGWYFDRGYVYAPLKGLLEPVDRFHERCGSSHILRFDLLDVPEIPLDASPGQIFEAFGSGIVLRIFGSHMYAVDHFRELGHPLCPLPFPGALYVVETGENHSGRQLRGLARPVNGALALEFSIPRTTSSTRTFGRAGVQALASAARYGVSRFGGGRNNEIPRE